MRLLRTLLVFKLGVYAGFAGAAAVMKRALPSRGDVESDEVGLVAIYDGLNLKSRAAAFRGGFMLAWFGGVAVDLREATLAPDARLTLHALFGGIAVRVPPGWRVDSELGALLGGVDVNVPEPEQPDAPTLALEGFALFGGVSVGTRELSET